MTAFIAREYQRVSFDASGRERSPEEQHGDNARAADRHGWSLGRPYRDIGSASRYARKVREDYARLVADLESGQFGASVLILWESSRGSRRLSEWVRLIELCEEQGIKIYVTSDGKLYDAGDARDRRSLQEDATDAEFESAKVSKRTKRAAAAQAADGMPGPGRPAFGFKRVYDARTGRLTGQEPDPVEAAIVREMYQRLAAGHSLRSIATDLTARGVRKRNGEPFSESTIRTIALNRANIGERVHDPGRPRGQRLTVSAVITPAVWPAIVDRAVWATVHQTLTAEDRRTSRSARAVHWLARIAVCDECDGPIAARLRHDMAERIYVCHAKTCSAVPYAELDAFVEERLLAYLQRADVAQALTATADDPVALAKAEAELATVQQDIEDLADRAAAGGPAARKLLDRNLPKLEARLAEAQARRDELIAPPRLRGLIEPGKKVRRHWSTAPLEVRREIARLVFVPEWLGELRVVKGPLRDPVEDRVLWRRS
jgi:DNA invertase Pin-like site-specific DNA recombinase